MQQLKRAGDLRVAGSPCAIESLHDETCLGWIVGFSAFVHCVSVADGDVGDRELTRVDNVRGAGCACANESTYDESCLGWIVGSSAFFIACQWRIAMKHLR